MKCSVQILSINETFFFTVAYKKGEYDPLIDSSHINNLLIWFFSLQILLCANKNAKEMKYSFGLPLV